MNAHNAEKLLGGYAAGILTEAEKQSLFSAALDNQELFNAMANEEVLRELLADAETRGHLLTLLSETTPVKTIPFWRRPTMLGLAASFFALVTTSVVLWQRERPLPSLPLVKEKAVELKMLAEKPAAKVAAEQSGTLNHSADTQAKGGASGLPPGAPALHRPNQSPLADAFLPRAQNVLKTEAVTDHVSELKKRDAAKTPSAATVEVISEAAAATADKSEAPTRAITKESGNAALGIAARNLPTVHSPTYVLERLENGKIRLSVTWASGNQLYVLKRSLLGPMLLRPTTSVTGEAGTTLSTFECLLGQEEHLDLYLVSKPIQNPKLLPGEGAFEGFRKRVI